MITVPIRVILNNVNDYTGQKIFFTQNGNEKCEELQGIRHINGAEVMVITNKSDVIFSIADRLKFLEKTTEREVVEIVVNKNIAESLKFIVENDNRFDSVEHLVKKALIHYFGKDLIEKGMING
jgi:hypothetical protein